MNTEVDPPRSEHESGPLEVYTEVDPPEVNMEVDPCRSEHGSVPPPEVDAEDVVEEDQLRSTAGASGWYALEKRLLCLFPHPKREKLTGTFFACMTVVTPPP